MLSDYQTLVAKFVQDDAGKVIADDLDTAIGLAVQRYSKDRPRLKVSDLTPSSANVLPLPALWETDFSELRSLEYPLAQNPPSFIAADRYGPYDNGVTVTIKLVDAVAVAANNVRASFTIAHVVSAAVDTIPVGDREPVACWAAASLCDELASFYSGGTDSTIQADDVKSQSKAQEYASRAKALRKRYLDELGVAEKRNIAAGTVVSLRNESSAGQSRLTHPMRRNWS
jgi:hypothetical protein